MNRDLVGEYGSAWLSQAVFGLSAVFLRSHGGVYGIRYERTLFAGRELSLASADEGH